MRLMLKFPDISEIFITYSYFNNRKMAKLSLDSRTLKTLISHLSTEVNLIQYFRSFFTAI